MLQIKNIYKSYVSGDFKQTALDNVSLTFRKSEFVAILGPSGSGKTTFLNVVGGLDQYDSGDLIINGKSTKKFKAKDWDAYRNNSVGFVFQSYNLIPHLNLLDNVEMGMTLSGVPFTVKRQKALEVLTDVGLIDHIHKKPNQLSGGQMQRVAIARALANNPDIILADEPTGALDSQTSVQIMDLIRKISQDKLVIMVTHNSEIASKYADRTVRFEDGRVISDTNPFTMDENGDQYHLVKTSMSFLTALKLSFKNILTKKGRTAITALASSIGIIGIALVLSLSNGFDKQISKYETGTLSNYPVTISKTAMNIVLRRVSQATGQPDEAEPEEFPATGKLYPYDAAASTSIHKNTITQDYVDYVSKIDPALLDGVTYTRSVSMNLLKMHDGKATGVNTSGISLSTFPSAIRDLSSTEYLKKYYDILAGNIGQNKTDLLLVVDEYNRLDLAALEALGFDTKADNIDLNSFVGYPLKLIMNDDYYVKAGNYFAVNGTATDLTPLYNSTKAVSLTISGVIRVKKDVNVAALDSGLICSDELVRFFIEDAKNSQIVKAQLNSDYNVLTGKLFSESTGGIGGMFRNTVLTKEDVLASLGATSIPASISLYPVDFDAKEKITAYLDKWNTNLSDSDQIRYTDMAAMITKLSGDIMSAITMVLIAFAAISLVVSMIMIGIIIYISVLERTKEIGILRALGARKKDITRVFNAETFIIGVFSGLLGIGLAYLLTIPANIILKKLTDLSNVAQLNPLHALLLVIISIILTLTGGFIPSKMAAKKDPVEALRNE